MRSRKPEYIVDENGCWVWNRSRNADGYGSRSYRGKLWGAHRVAWVESGRVLPLGASVLHRCDNPPCVNPDHLFLGSPLDNARDRDAKGRGADNSSQLRDPEAQARSGLSRRRLDPDQAAAIQARYRLEHIRQADLAAEYGVSQQTISNVLRGTYASWYAGAKR